MTSIAVTANVVQEVVPNVVPNSPSDLPIALETTPLGDTLPNKYLYPEFAGLSGERYLLSLAEQFAPLALWRTWQAMVSYQAPDNVCYVGVSLLVDRKRGRVGVKERKIYLDLAAMEERGWLIMTRVRMPFVQQDNSIAYHPVTVKDFSGFYETAHDYHLWLHDPMYLAPERENIPLIMEDPELMKRLVTFENYRRLLLCGKPGRKRNTERDDCYQGEQERVVQPRTSDPKVNQYFNPLTKGDSPYRRDGTDQQPLDRGSILSTSEKGTGVAAMTIRNEVTGSQPETMETKNRKAESESKSNPPVPPTGENAAEDAKRVKTVQGYTEEELQRDVKKRGAAVVGIPAEQYAKLNGAPDDQAEPERQEQEKRTIKRETREGSYRHRQEMPAALRKHVVQCVQSYDDPHLIKSDLSRATKLYMTAWQAFTHIPEQHQFDNLYLALFDRAAAKAATLASEHTNSRGQTNIVPYLFACFENSFELSLEELVYLRTSNPLYADSSLWKFVDDARDTYKQQYASGEVEVDYAEWLQLALDKLEHCKQPKARPNRPQREE